MSIYGGIMMSIWSDYDDGCITAEVIAERRLEALADKGLWLDKEGNEIKIKDMSSEHIKNCINWINKEESRYYFFLQYIPIFEKELKNRVYASLNSEG